MSDFDDFTPAAPTPKGTNAENLARAQAHVGEDEDTRLSLVSHEYDTETDPRVKEALGREKARLPASAAAVGAKAPKAPPPSDFDDFAPAAKGEEKGPMVDFMKGFGGTMKNVGAAFDIVESVIPMLGASTADALARMNAMTQGKSHEEGSAAGAQAFDEFMGTFGNPVEHLLKLGKGEGLEKTAVNQAMGKVGTALQEEGNEIEYATGGAINSQDFMSIANAFMAAGGAKGAKVGGDALMAKILEKKAAGEKAPVTAAVNDMSFGLDLPDSQKKGLAKAAGEADARANEAATSRADTPPPAGPDTLESIAAIKAKPGFLQTPEDRLAVKAWDEKGATEKGLDEVLGVAITPEGGRSAEGKARLQTAGRVGLAALGGLAAWEALSPDDKNQVLTVTAMALGVAVPEASRHIESLRQINELPEASPLGAVLDRSTYGSKTLERLPQGTFDFSKEHIKQELKRQDVTEAERAALTNALEQKPGERITAKDLVLGFRKAVGDFELERKETDEYADYGLDGIGRMKETAWDPDHPAAVPSTTSLYRLPAHMELSDANHFSDPNLFGWTRSFEEEGVRHVVEIQSDLAQKNKGMAPEARAEAESGIEDAKKRATEIKERMNEYSDAMGDRERSQTELTALRRNYQNALQDYQRETAKVAELGAALEGGSKADSVAPIVKNWPKRLVREELASAARGKEALVNRFRPEIANLEDALRRMPKDDIDRPEAETMLRDAKDSLAKAQESERVVRFATADTVAKVEGWPKVDPLRQAEDRYEQAARHYRNLDEQAQRYREVHKAGGTGQWEYGGEGGRTGKEVWHKFTPEELEAQKEGIAADREKVARAEEEADRQYKALEEVRKTRPEPALRPEHQSIYDRYKRDIEKFLKQQGGKEHTDAHGHTWIEVPVPKKGPTQMFGGADPKMLGILAAGMIGGYLGYKASDSISGGVLGALTGYLGARMVPGLRESLARTPAARAAVVELRDRLYTLGQANKARGLDMLRYLQKELPKDWAENASAIYEHMANGKGELSDRAKELKRTIIDPLQAGSRAYITLLKKLGYPAADLLEDYGLHRLPVGAKRSFFDTISSGALPFAKGFSTSAEATKARTVHDWSTASGESYIGVQEKGGKVGLWKDGKLVTKGTLNPKTGELKAQGKSFMKKEASVEDIEKHTDIRYEKEPLITEMNANFRLGQAVGNAMFLEALPHMPGFEEFAGKFKEGGEPAGWVKVHGLPGLSDHYFEPHIAEALKDFIGQGSGHEWVNALGKMNRFLIGSMFWNPLPHILNVADHALVEKGLIGNVVGFPQTLKGGFEAYRAVSNLSPKYLAYLREGAAFMYPDTLLGDFTKKALEAVGKEKGMGPVAQAFGYANPIEMTKRLYEHSRQSLWKWNDILMMQAYLAKEAKGMTKEGAIKEVEKHIPNYRLPERVLGSRALQSALSHPAAMTFGRYDYGRLASYGNMVKDLLGKDSTLKDRAHALDQMAMLAVSATLLYPQVADTFAKWLTGNQNAEWTRFGAATIPTLLYKVWNGEELGSNALSRMFHVSPMWELIPEVMANRDLHTGGAFAHTPGEAAKKAGKEIAPVNMMQQGEEGKLSSEQLFWSALGIKSPTDLQLRKKAAYLERQKAETAAYKKKHP